MKRRDESIQAASAVFAENRGRVRQKKQTLDEQAKLLESEKGKNVSTSSGRRLTKAHLISVITTLSSFQEARGGEVSLSTPVSEGRERM